MTDRAFEGRWVANPSRSRLHPDFKYRDVVLEIRLSADGVTMVNELVDERGNQQRAAETFRTDGTETQGTITPGVTHIARWIGPDVLALIARKDGRTIALATYELSADGKTLTARSSGLLEQVTVFER